MSTDWNELLDLGDYARIARALIGECPNLDLEALADDAWSAIDTMTTPKIVVQDTLPGTCRGGGYYDRTNVTIYLHPSGWRRNNFTLLHELGHHVQQHHDEWAYLLLDGVPRDDQLRVEEAVSNSFAAEILLGTAADTADGIDVSPALVAAGLFSSTGASRSAVIEEVSRRLRNKARWILAVADLDGRVQYAAQTFEQFPPKKGMVQPGFAALAAEAEDGPVRRSFTEGLVYQYGRELHDMKAEAVLDQTGQWVFVGLTPIHRFGMGKVENITYECAWDACEIEEFTATPETDWCQGSCKDPRCPSCGRCRCAGTNSSYSCPRCWTAVTAFEAANDLHAC